MRLQIGFLVPNQRKQGRDIFHSNSVTNYGARTIMSQYNEQFSKVNIFNIPLKDFK